MQFALAMHSGPCALFCSVECSVAFCADKKKGCWQHVWTLSLWSSNNSPNLNALIGCRLERCQWFGIGLAPSVGTHFGATKSWIDAMKTKPSTSSWDHAPCCCTNWCWLWQMSVPGAWYKNRNWTCWRIKSNVLESLQHQTIPECFLSLILSIMVRSRLPMFGWGTCPVATVVLLLPRRRRMLAMNTLRSASK